MIVIFGEIHVKFFFIIYIKIIPTSASIKLFICDIISSKKLSLNVWLVFGSSPNKFRRECTKLAVSCFFFLRGVPRFTSRHKKIANTPPSSRLFKRYQLLWDCGAAINIFRDQRFKFFKLCDLVTKKISQLISEINFSVADDFSGRLPLSWFRVWHFFRIYSVYLLHHVSEENFSYFLYLRLQ